MSVLAIYTLLHVAISLVGIATGFAVLGGLLTNRLPDKTNAIFLTTTILTSVTGFGFPADQILPAHIFGVISLVVLAVTLFALFARRLQGIWRPTFVVTALFAQYLNVFVLIVQSFLKIPALHALAPTQTELPFALAQGVTLVAFLVLGTLAVIRFRPVGNRPAIDIKSATTQFTGSNQGPSHA